MKSKDFKEMAGKFLKNKYALGVLLVGLALLLLPTGGADRDAPAPAGTELAAPDFSIAGEEKRLAGALEQIDGAGEVTVLLSLKSTASRELAQGKEQPLVISTGSGTQSAVELWYDYPEYLGAVIISSGAQSSRVKLDIVKSVSAFTGLPSDRITVIRMK